MNKELKYLKIFEAFESIKLSKTLNYIKDPKSKNTFMELLKTIANQMDLPLSKYSDEYFRNPDSNLQRIFIYPGTSL